MAFPTALRLSDLYFRLKHRTKYEYYREQLIYFEITEHTRGDKHVTTVSKYEMNKMGRGGVERG